MILRRESLDGNWTVNIPNFSVLDNWDGAILNKDIRYTIFCNGVFVGTCFPHQLSQTITSANVYDIVGGTQHVRVRREKDRVE